MIENLWKQLEAHSVASAVTSGMVLLLIGGIIRWSWNKYRAKMIYGILRRELKSRGKNFLSTQFLSSQSGYTEATVEKLCCQHERIKRNEKELPVWRLDE